MPNVRQAPRVRSLGKTVFSHTEWLFSCLALLLGALATIPAATLRSRSEFVSDSGVESIAGPTLISQLDGAALGVLYALALLAILSVAGGWSRIGSSTRIVLALFSLLAVTLSLASIGLYYVPAAIAAVAAAAAELAHPIGLSTRRH